MLIWASGYPVAEQSPFAVGSVYLFCGLFLLHFHFSEEDKMVGDPAGNRRNDGEQLPSYQICCF
jgi:hypothetical protein